LFAGPEYAMDLAPRSLVGHSTEQFRVIVESAVGPDLMPCWDEVVAMITRGACGAVPDYPEHLAYGPDAPYEPTTATAYFQTHGEWAVPGESYDSDDAITAFETARGAGLTSPGLCVPVGATRSEWAELAGEGPCALKNWDVYESELEEVLLFNQMEMGKIQSEAAKERAEVVREAEEEALLAAQYVRFLSFAARRLFLLVLSPGTRPPTPRGRRRRSGGTSRCCAGPGCRRSRCCSTFSCSRSSAASRRARRRPSTRCCPSSQTPPRARAPPRPGV
jgi:hypothetical protein